MAGIVEATESVLDDSRRRGRKLVAKGRRFAEDAAADAVQQVRRRPGRALLVAGAAGALIGGAIGLVLGATARRACS